MFVYISESQRKYARGNPFAFAKLRHVTAQESNTLHRLGMFTQNSSFLFWFQFHLTLKMPELYDAKERSIVVSYFVSINMSKDFRAWPLAKPLVNVNRPYRQQVAELYW